MPPFSSRKLKSGALFCACRFTPSLRSDDRRQGAGPQSRPEPPWGGSFDTPGRRHPPPSFRAWPGTQTRVCILDADVGELRIAAIPLRQSRKTARNNVSGPPSINLERLNSYGESSSQTSPARQLGKSQKPARTPKGSDHKWSCENHCTTHAPLNAFYPIHGIT